MNSHDGCGVVSLIRKLAAFIRMRKTMLQAAKAKSKEKLKHTQLWRKQKPALSAPPILQNHL